MKVNLAKKIGQRIRWARQHFGVSGMKKITQKELSKLSKVEAMHISHFECGRRTPHAKNLINLSQALGVSVDWMLGLEEL